MRRWRSLPRQDGGSPRRGGVKSITTDMWNVYILKSLKDNKHYIGCTNDLERRMSEHNSGYNVSTRSRLPLELVYFESFEESEIAFAREKQIKSYKGGNAFIKLLKK